MKLFVLHGPNLNLTGTRETDIYGTTSLADIDAQIRAAAEANGFDEVTVLQSNHEGVLIDALHDAASADAVIFNPGGYTHTSVSIRDAIAAIDTPCIVVHLSNCAARERFRRIDLMAPVAAGVISGFGAESYLLAVVAAAHLGKRSPKDQKGR